MPGQLEAQSRTKWAVLVVEENDHERLLYEWELRDAGYSVVSVPSPCAAMKHLNPDYPDIAVVDPGRCSVGEMDRIGQLLARAPGTPVVIYTGYEAGVLGEKLRARSPMRRVTSCLTKTSDLSRLMDEIRRVLTDAIDDSRGVTCRGS